MRHIRLYTREALQPGATVALDPQASNHLSRVLRARVGDTVALFNGDGFDYPGVVASTDKRDTRVTLSGAPIEVAHRALRSHLGLALSKGDRFDWAVQKSTELGVAAITPIYSDHCDFKLTGDRVLKKVAHWQQIAASACEQCGRADLPRIHPVASLEDWASEVTASLKLVLHPGEQRPLPDAAPGTVALLVGPEGGLSERDLSLAHASGFSGFVVGPRILRTETAPVAALAILGAKWGDLG